MQYHLVWCTKYRKKVLKNGIDTECKEMLQNLAEEYKFQILAMEVMPDHIHLLVDCKPQFYISDMIKIMKGNLARQMFLVHPELKEELWGGDLWNPSYCAITVSDRSRDQVLAYIEAPNHTGDATLPLRWLPPATLLWTCHLGTPCVASCSQPTSFIKYAIFSIGSEV